MSSTEPLEIPWRRLDRKMLLIEPVRAVKDFLPVIIGFLILGSGSWTDAPWQLAAVVFPIVWGVLRYYTTWFRVSEGRLELRRGLINRQRRSTPLERIRSVDLTSTLLHRVMGLTSMRIGTGTTSIGDDDLALDGLSTEAAAILRAELLAHGAAPPPVAEGEPGDPDAEVVPEPLAPPTEVVARLNPTWARYAPLTTVGLLAPLALVGGGFHLVSQYELGDELDAVAVRFAAGVVVALAATVVLVLALVVPVANYLMVNWGFTLTREPDAWGVRRGLFTTRQTHLDRTRVAGLDLAEPLPLRLAGGARLDAIALGTKLLSDDSAVLLPAAPRRVVDEVGSAVLGTSVPVGAPLGPHGAAATRRRWTRALVPAAMFVAAAVAGWLAGILPAWTLGPVAVVPLAAAVLAADRSRTLGHALADGHLVVRSGSLTCSRQALATPRIIGWKLRSTWFQRRVGLVTLVATTAGGPQSITALDIPAEDAVDVATAAIPGLVSQFVVS